jgi:hypothetical protein
MTGGSGRRGLVDMSEVGGFELLFDSGGYRGGKQESEVQSRVKGEDVE